jgi:ketosteroid isomerase-like protein
MKKILLFVLVLSSIGSAAQSKPMRTGTGGDETAVRRLLDEQTTAWNHGDIDGFMQGYWKNDSLMFIGKSGITYGWSNTLNNYKKSYPDTVAMGKLAFTIINAKKLSPEYFHITGKFHLQRSIGDLQGYFTLLFRKIKGRWVIIADHTS